MPTVVLASNGVNKKWFLGLTTNTSNFFLSIALRKAKLDHPVPRTTNFFLPVFTCEEKSMSLFFLPVFTCEEKSMSLLLVQFSAYFTKPHLKELYNLSLNSFCDKNVTSFAALPVAGPDCIFFDVCIVWRHLVVQLLYFLL